MSKSVTDHLQNTYPTLEIMCAHYQIPPERYSMRLRLGWSVEDALTKKDRQNSIKCTDHLGNEFESVAAMCDFHDIEPALYRFRIKNGWGKEKALTKQPRKYGCA